MKTLLRAYTFHLIALWTTTNVLAPAFTIKDGFTNYLFAALVLAVLNLLLRPILRLLFLPINALTLGLFSWVINAALFYFFVMLVPAVTIIPWKFPGFIFQSISIPEIQLSFWVTLFVASFLVGVVTNFLSYLTK